MHADLDDLLDSDIGPDEHAVLPLLAHGDVDVLGRMPWSSNGTYLVTVDDGIHHTQAIYKPEAGERPLWDFPPGLWRRELAMYLLAEQLGWHVVPPTVGRDDAPLGVGSLQYFVPARYEDHYFTVRDLPELRGPLERVCVLDLVANNCDRKGGHCLIGRDGRLWAIDNGLSFHAELKLRTVMWDFAGEPIPEAIVADLRRLLDEGLGDELSALLDTDERRAACARARAVVRGGVFPSDPTGRRYPWPLV